MYRLLRVFFQLVYVVCLPRSQHEKEFRERYRRRTDAVQSLKSLDFVRKHLRQVDQLTQSTDVYERAGEYQHQ